jgi:hypothetical protein
MPANLNRRAVLAGATAAAIPTAAVATLPSLEPYPIFAAIEAHRFAWDEYNRRGSALDAAIRRKRTLREIG